MVKLGGILVSCDPLSIAIRALIPLRRTLLLDVGESSKSLRCISTSFDESEGCQGKLYALSPYSSFEVAPSDLLKDPMLWYGIGILYDRYGSYDYAEEAFSQVMQIQPDFDKANEIYFRLGIIYKQQSKFQQSLDVGRSPFSSPCNSATNFKFI